MYIQFIDNQEKGQKSKIHISMMVFLMLMPFAYLLVIIFCSSHPKCIQFSILLILYYCYFVYALLENIGDINSTVLARGWGKINEHRY